MNALSRTMSAEVKQLNALSIKTERLDNDGIMALENSSPTDKLAYLRNACEKIQSKDWGGLSYNEIYFVVYEVIKKKGANQLFDEFISSIEHYLTNTVKPQVTDDINQSQMDSFVDIWDNHLKSLEIFRKLLYFLDKEVSRHISSQNLEDAGINLYKTLIFLPNKDQIRHYFLNTIRAERTGEIGCNAIQLKQVIDVIIVTSGYSYYETYLEESFLRESDEFYKTQIQNHYTEGGDTINYINMYLKFVHDEKVRIGKYLHEKTEPKILKILYNNFVKNNLNNLPQIESDLHKIFDWRIEIDECKNYDKYLTILYKWFGENSSTHILHNYVSNTFREKGSSIVETTKYQDYADIIEDMQKLKKRFCDYNERCFNDSVICSNIESDFVDIFNKNKRMAEYLALYISKILKNKELTEPELDRKIDNFMDLYKMLIDKDLFEGFYKSNLTKRLLGIKPTSTDLEKKVISRLKTECASFTKTLEDMLNDLEVSSTHMQLFSDDLNINELDLGDCDFSVKVLRQGLWKITQCSECILPATFSTLYEIYHEFYKRCHNGRKLQLQYNMGDVQMSAFFKNPKNQKKLKYTLNVSTFQMLILLLFNDHEELTFNEIKDLTKIPEDRLRFSLIPLAIGKPCHKILSKVNSDSKGILENDKFRINESFSSKTHRVKIPFQMTTITEINNNADKIYTRTEEERKHEINAAIVRIMKARKELNEVSLTEEVMSQLSKRFKPTGMAIKSSILYLIDREYIGRHATREKTYIYIA